MHGAQGQRALGSIATLASKARVSSSACKSKATSTSAQLCTLLPMAPILASITAGSTALRSFRTAVFISDLNYGAVFLVNTPLLEIVDDKWRTEKLPDDDILLPPEMPPIDELDEQRDKKEEDKWTELALTDFTPQSSSN